MSWLFGKKNVERKPSPIPTQADAASARIEAEDTYNYGRIVVLQPGGVGGPAGQFCEVTLSISNIELVVEALRFTQSFFRPGRFEEPWGRSLSQSDIQLSLEFFRKVLHDQSITAIKISDDDRRTAAGALLARAHMRAIVQTFNPGETQQDRENAEAGRRLLRSADEVAEALIKQEVRG